MSQRYDGNTKKPKPKENQPVILKIYSFCRKILQMASGPGESAAGWGYVLICGNKPKKLPQLSGSRKIAVGTQSHKKN